MEFIIIKKTLNKLHKETNQMGWFTGQERGMTNPQILPLCIYVILISYTASQMLG